METWKALLSQSVLIFMNHCSANAHLLFGFDKAPVSHRDCRLRSFPFSTRKATFEELQRCYEGVIRVRSGSACSASSESGSENETVCSESDSGSSQGGSGSE
jgi:hypothetical protein